MEDYVRFKCRYQAVLRGGHCLVISVLIGFRGPLVKKTIPDDLTVETFTYKMEIETFYRKIEGSLNDRPA